ncbi:hypothetical protein [Stenotrophomonas beteli]|uniref:hypothetical protein n=1 Tax=Stenotrophomonas beteli TaxID=3384461 RepID=UPI00128FBDA5|nr:hypothetical protein [Stenotrophomonas maltophilia]
MTIMKMASSKWLLSVASLIALALPGAVLASDPDPEVDPDSASDKIRETVRKTPEAQALYKKYTDCEASGADADCSEHLLDYLSYVDREVSKALTSYLK